MERYSMFQRSSTPLFTKYWQGMLPNVVSGIFLLVLTLFLKEIVGYYIDYSLIREQESFSGTRNDPKCGHLVKIFSTASSVNW
jgi:hypothetical protein